MGIMMTNENTSSDLNRRIRADLRNRVVDTNTIQEEFLNESSTKEKTKKTGRFAWVWVVLVVLAIISLILITVI